MVQAGKRTPCSWVIQTSKGEHGCSFQASVTFAGRDYCKTHAKLMKAGMGPPPLPSAQVRVSVAGQQLPSQPAMVRPTADSIAVAQAICILTREGASETVVAYLLDGFVSNVMRKMSGMATRGAA